MKNARRQSVISAVGLTVLVTMSACSSSQPQATPESATTTSAGASTPASASTTLVSGTKSSTASSTSSSVAPPDIMPDFVGKTVDDAQAVLKPLNVKIKTVNLISAQPAGTITAQDPVAGADFAQSVTLTVSIAPPAVPDVTQKTFGNAQQTLTDLGFTVKETPVFDEKLADGLVVAQDPPAGATNASEITLNVVRRPVVTYLSDMSTVAQNSLSYAPGIQKSNGKSYPHGILISPYSAGGSVEYDFSRQYRQLTGELGFDDKASSDATAQIEIYGDGRLLTEQNITFGTTTPVQVDVTDVLRVRIAVSVTGGKGSVVLGDFRAQGLQSEVSPTTSSSSH